MDGFEVNKIAGAVLLAGIIAMVTGLLARTLVPEPHHDVAVIGAPAGGPAAPRPGTRQPDSVEPILPLLASASVEEGASVARKCAACHTFEKGGPNKVGPNLWAVVGADKAHLEGFNYSNSLAGMEGTWSYEALDRFLHKPSQYVPGTKMAFAGLSRPQERAAVIAYMRTMHDDPPPLPTPEEIERAQQEAAAPAPAESTQAASAPAAAQQPAAAAGPEPVAPLLAAASVEEGQKVFRKCAACHTFEKGGPNKVGPNLSDVVGAEKAHRDDYNYSRALASLEGEWTYEDLNAYIADPRGFAPGNKMAFAGLKRVEERAAVIAFLRAHSENPPPLPEAAQTAQTPAEQQQPGAASPAVPAQGQQPAPAQDETPGRGGTPMQTAPAPQGGAGQEQPAAQASPAGAAPGDSGRDATVPRGDRPSQGGTPMEIAPAPAGGTPDDRPVSPDTQDSPPPGQPPRGEPPQAEPQKPQ